eukprot:1183333-Prorocentrum_minimum.AAC.2
MEAGYLIIAALLVPPPQLCGVWTWKLMGKRNDKAALSTSYPSASTSRHSHTTGEGGPGGRQ